MCVRVQVGGRVVLIQVMRERVCEVVMGVSIKRAWVGV